MVVMSESWLKGNNTTSLRNLAVDQERMRHHHTTTVLRPFFQGHPAELVPEENFWTLWCKGRLTEADTHKPSGWAPLHPD